MCLAIYKPKGVSIAKKYLRNAFDNNDDGAGFAVCDDGKVSVYKGYFKFNDFYSTFAPFQKSQAIIHFRLATHGKTSAENCHPFTINNDTYAVIHNGVISIRCDKNKDLSDTWHFSELVLAPMLSGVALDSPALRYLVEEAIGSYNKIVVLKGDGSHVIFNEGKGSWHKGAWYSNDGYKQRKSAWLSNWSPCSGGTSGEQTALLPKEYWNKLQYGNTDYDTGKQAFPDYESSNYVSGDLSPEEMEEINELVKDGILTEEKPPLD